MMRLDLMSEICDTFSIPALGSFAVLDGGKSRWCHVKYQLGYKKTGDEKTDARSQATLEAAVKGTVTKLITNVPYMLYIRAVEETHSEDMVVMSLRCCVVNGKWD